MTGRSPGSGHRGRARGRGGGKGGGRDTAHGNRQGPVRGRRTPARTCAYPLQWDAGPQARAGVVGPQIAQRMHLTAFQEPPTCEGARQRCGGRACPTAAKRISPCPSSPSQKTGLCSSMWETIVGRQPSRRATRWACARAQARARLHARAHAQVRVQRHRRHEHQQRHTHTQAQVHARTQ